MAIDVRIKQLPKWNANDYSLIEDSTPIDASDSTGGFGSFTIELPEEVDSRSTRGKSVDLEDSYQGTTVGTARGAGGGMGAATIRADSRLGSLAVTRTAAPFTGTLGNAIRYYFGLCGVDTDVAIDTSIDTRPVTYIGWRANVWDKVKELCAAHAIEVSLVSDVVVVREARQRVAERYRDSSVTWSVDDTQLAQSVEAKYYEGAYKTKSLAYPAGGWNERVQILQVDAGETLEVELEMGASLKTVKQPTCVASVAVAYGSESVYTISGNDGVIIQPAQWTAGGGSVTVEIGEDTRTLKLKIQAPAEEEYAPYRLSMPSGTSDGYSSLRIVGEGVFFTQESLTLNLGVSEDFAAQELGATVDIPFLTSKQEAFEALLWTAARYAGPSLEINVATTGINRLGDAGGYVALTMADFNSKYAGLANMGAFNTLHAGMTMGQYNELQREDTKLNFENQAFGNVAGARVFEDGNWLRIRTATITPGGITYTAERDNSMGDFNERYAGMTMKQFNLLHAGKSMGGFDARPLA